MGWAPHPSTPVNSRGWGRERGEFERFRGHSCLTVPPTCRARGCRVVANRRRNSHNPRGLRRPCRDARGVPSRPRFLSAASPTKEVAPHAPRVVGTFSSSRGRRPRLGDRRASGRRARLQARRHRPSCPDRRFSRLLTTVRSTPGVNWSPPNGGPPTLGPTGRHVPPWQALRTIVHSVVAHSMAQESSKTPRAEYATHFGRQLASRSMTSGRCPQSTSSRQSRRDQRRT